MNETKTTGRHWAGGYSKRAKMPAAARLVAKSASATAPGGAGLGAPVAPPEDAPVAAAGGASAVPRDRVEPVAAPGSSATAMTVGPASGSAGAAVVVLVIGAAFGRDAV